MSANKTKIEKPNNTLDNVENCLDFNEQINQTGRRRT